MKKTNYEEGWKRDLHIRWASIVSHNNSIIVTERNNYLSKVNPNNGESFWSTKVNNSCGWITAYEDKIYYLEQDGILKIINFRTGIIEKEHKLYYPYLGYIIANNDYLITGSWRGYSDLTCLNNDNQFSINWVKPTQSKEITLYSLPVINGENMLIADNTNNYLTSIDIDTGKENWKVKLPESIGMVDRGYTFKIHRNKIIVYSKVGKIYSFSEDIMEWNCEISHTCGIRTVTPKILENQYIFQDSENFICSYDVDDKNMRWNFLSNHVNFRIPAIEVQNGCTLVGFNMGKQKIINKEGDIVKYLKSERRYGSDFIKIRDDIFYLTKNELKQLKRKNGC